MIKIIDEKILRGPSYWSNYRKKLIALKIDIGKYENRPTNRIPDFLDRIKAVLPGLQFHRCSVGEIGGFLKRIEKGTWAGHVIEHIALELQLQAGMNTGFGRTRPANEIGTYFVVFDYEDEEAGLYAGEKAVNIFEKICGRTAPASIINKVHKVVEELKHIHQKNKYGPSTFSIVQEAHKRDIPVKRIDGDSFVQLGYGVKQKRIDATITSTSGYIAVDLASNKDETKKLLASLCVPVPKGYLIKKAAELNDVLRKINYPVVIKPLDANWGRGVTTNINNYPDAFSAFKKAYKISKEVIVEEFIEGKDYRVLVINKKLVAAAERIPANVVGDGESTIQQLVDIINNDPWRGEGHENILTKIKIDSNSKEILKAKNYTLETVLPKDEILYLKSTANLSTGGTAINVTDKIHPDNKFIFERAAAIIGLDICGIDVIAENLSEPLSETGGKIIEVNAAPGFRMHLSPSCGSQINVAKDVVDMLFPQNDDGRIPIFAITGTNGKTTTTRLIAHTLELTGKIVGSTTTDGIYINNYMIEKGDTTGPISANKILSDPNVEVAVLETARGGILRSGLAFDHCDYGIITNVTEDHLGLDDIYTIEQMFNVKSVVANSVKRNGYLILNADDPLVLKMRDDVSCKIVLFSMVHDNPEIIKHMESGGIAAVIDKGNIVIHHAGRRIILNNIKNVPITFNGTAECMVQNTLAAAAALYCAHTPVNTIVQGLNNFISDEKNNPGRFNLFNFKKFAIMVDYAHNPAGFNALKSFLKNYPSTKKTGVFEGTGDRRDDDIKELGKIASTMFDKIIIKEDTYMLRGRKPGEQPKLILDGLKEGGFNKETLVIEEEFKALDNAVQNAEEGEIIVFLASKIHEVIKRINQLIKEEVLIRKNTYD